MNKQKAAWFFGWLVTRKGSSTSGNWMHKGDPPNRGGSAPGGGHAAMGIAAGTPTEEVKEATQARREEMKAKKEKRKEPFPSAGKPAYTDAILDKRAANTIFGSVQDGYYEAGYILGFSDKGIEQMSRERGYLLNPSQGIHQKQVASALVAWKETSNDHDMRSLSLQGAVSEEFGVPLSDWQKKRIAEVKSGNIPEEIKEKQGKDPAIKYATMERDQERTFVRAMYDETQAFFQRAGYKPEDTITVFRGVGTESYAKKGDVVNMNQNAMSSWSLLPEAAKGFAMGAVDLGETPRGIALAMEIPISSILSTPRTGFGVAIEAEIVVLGTPGNQARVVEIY